MIRLVRGIALSALLMSLPMSASAFGISIVGVSSTSGSTRLAAGDTITIDLIAENNGGVELNGLGLVATGYDNDRNGVADSGLAFSSGTATDGLFNIIRNPGVPNQAFGGLPNVRSDANGGVIEQWAFDNFDPQELRTTFFAGASLGSTTGSGGDDVGVGGNYVGDGDIHFQITFQALALSTFDGDSFLTLEFGTDSQYGEIAVAPDGSTIGGFNNALLDIVVVPEPGTALLMGLGLAGLAANRRR